MQAHVKTPHIKIDIKGKISKQLLSFLKKEYGENLKIFKDDDYVNVFESGWYKNIKKNITPGKALKHYRELHKLTQIKLGTMLGGIPRQHISNMENGIRPIPIPIAKKIAEIFDIPVDRFI